MLLIRTTVGLTSSHGLGLFAAEFVPARSVVWRANRISPVYFTEDELDKLPGTMRELVLFYGFMERDTGKFGLDVDNARFVNHAEHPNVFSSRNGVEMIARIALNPGDEITINYRRVDGMTDPERIDRFPHRHFLKDGPGGTFD